MNVQDTVNHFIAAMQHCDNHVTVHRALGNGSRGQRGPETSLNRGVIVLTVASWQAFVQDLTLALRDAARAQVKTMTGMPTVVTMAMQKWEADVANAVGMFSTPDKAKSVALLGRVGFDPFAHWSWHQQGGRGRAPMKVEPAHVEKVLDGWVKARHAVAHGHATIDPMPILSAVRDSQSSQKLKKAPPLRLADAEDCMRFFRSVVRRTADAAAQHAGQTPPTWSHTPPLALGVHVSALASWNP